MRGASRTAGLTGRAEGSEPFARGPRAGHPASQPRMGDRRSVEQHEPARAGERGNHAEQKGKDVSGHDDRPSAVASLPSWNRVSVCGGIAALMKHGPACSVRAMTRGPARSVPRHDRRRSPRLLRGYGVACFRTETCEADRTMLWIRRSNGRGEPGPYEGMVRLHTALQDPPERCSGRGGARAPKPRSRDEPGCPRAAHADFGPSSVIGG